MERRTMLKRLGLASAGTAGLAGNVSARKTDSEQLFASVDRTIDTRDVSGKVPLTELLTEQELAQIDADVDARRVTLFIEEDQDVLNVEENLCNMGCCSWWYGHCPSGECSRCYCVNCSAVIGA